MVVNAVEHVIFHWMKCSSVHAKKSDNLKKKKILFKMFLFSV